MFVPRFRARDRGPGLRGFRPWLSNTVHMFLTFWICAIVTLVSAGVSLGYSITELRHAQTASREASMYAFARSLALAIVAAVALFLGSVPFVAAVAIAMIAVQGADAFIGAMSRRRLETLGPAVTAAINAVALVWMIL